MYLKYKAGESATLQIIIQWNSGYAQSATHSGCYDFNGINTSTILEVNNVFALELRLSVVAQSVFCPSLVRPNSSFWESSVPVKFTKVCFSCRKKKKKLKKQQQHCTFKRGCSSSAKHEIRIGSAIPRKCETRDPKTRSPSYTKQKIKVTPCDIGT